jgi:hypothetical protein
MYRPPLHRAAIGLRIRGRWVHLKMTIKRAAARPFGSDRKRRNGRCHGHAMAVFAADRLNQLHLQHQLLSFNPINLRYLNEVFTFLQTQMIAPIVG